MALTGWPAQQCPAAMAAFCTTLTSLSLVRATMRCIALCLEATSSHAGPLDSASVPLTVDVLDGKADEFS